MLFDATPRDRDNCYRIPASDSFRITLNDLCNKWKLVLVKEELRSSFNSIRRHPTPSAFVVLTIAIGVGINVSVFSAVNVVLFRPLPYPAPYELVRIAGHDAHFGQTPFSYPDFMDWRNSQHAFSGMSAYTVESLSLRTVAQSPERVAAAICSANLFSVLGTPPRAGRSFTDEEDRKLTTSAVPIILSHRFAMRRFAGQAMGQTFSVGGTVCEVVGVASPLVEHPSNVDVFLPVAFVAARQGYTSRDDRRFYGIGRLRRNWSVARAQEDLQRCAAALAMQYPDSNADTSAAVAADLDNSVRHYRTSFYLLLGAATAILLITSVNVANLRLSQIYNRSHELAVRAALGANAIRLTRMLFAEGAILALAGGIVGATLAIWSSTALAAFAPPDLPRLGKFNTADPLLFLYFAIVMIVTIAVGVVPTLRIDFGRLAVLLQQAGPTSSSNPARQRLQSFFVVAQVAFSFALYVTALLLLQTLWRLERTPLGFDAANLLTAHLSVGAEQYQDELAITRFFDRLVADVRTIPGVDVVALSNSPPFSGTHVRTTLLPASAEQTRNKAAFPVSRAENVSDSYFQCLRISIVQGRSFSVQDNAQAPPVVMVNRTFSKQYNADAKIVGTPLLSPNDQLKKVVVVGIAADVQHDEIGSPQPSTAVYFPFQQRPTATATLLVRTRSDYDPMAIVPTIRRIVEAIDPNLPVYDAQPMSMLVSRSLAPQRTAARVVLMFSALALLLTAIGLGGLLANVVSYRTREFGIRLALGSQRHDVFVLVLRDGMKLTGIGLFVGGCSVLLIHRILTSFVVALAPVSLRSICQGAVLLFVVTIVGAFIPARRASLVDPAAAIRATG